MGEGLSDLDELVICTHFCARQPFNTESATCDVGDGRYIAS